ncbi:hypothetical protein TraAM80_09898 [Trypanosoma rangeli]|uniref:Uncharacterized protein n=1 Tax=Trypanosoma rangeli TaxID=5698 RepID=A0A422MSQ6_TRYRA|nr:uncharacterized protein TraAM80_09898 [Trypanosoma rangeli]RNE96252.1 hypothetical protein TraAM80_09898 [Trypanosoma rangeli]|eukprot:RNE96252.1 hypothetical protein TraAM80_09898 [Trypanosoma rangeli]
MRPDGVGNTRSGETIRVLLSRLHSCPPNATYKKSVAAYSPLQEQKRQPHSAVTAPPSEPTQYSFLFNAARQSRIAAVCCFSPPSPIPATHVAAPPWHCAAAVPPTTSTGVRICPPPHPDAPYSEP